MKNIKKFIVALSLVLGLAACTENQPFTEVAIGETPVYEISDIALVSGTENASDVLTYTVYSEFSNMIAWQTNAYTLRKNTIENLWAGNALIAGDTEQETVTAKLIKFDEVYTGEVTMTSSTGEITTSTVNMRRRFDISASAEDGVGTMKITEYDNSVAEYTIVLTEIEERKEL